MARPMPAALSQLSPGRLINFEVILFLLPQKQSDVWCARPQFGFLRKGQRQTYIHILPWEWLL